MTNGIVTVTLNPAIDRTVWLDRLVPGRTHRSTDTRATIGCLTELIDSHTAEDLRDRFAAIAAAALDWDGSDPIRGL